MSSGYTVEDLERMKAECERNIAALERGIERERANIAHYQEVIDAETEKAAQLELIDKVNNKAIGLLKKMLSEDDGDSPVVVRVGDVARECAD